MRLGVGSLLLCLAACSAPTEPLPPGGDAGSSRAPEDAGSPERVSTCDDLGPDLDASAAALQGRLDGELVVLVRLHSEVPVMTVPVAGALVRAWRAGLELEGLTDPRGCVRFRNPGLVHPLAVDVYTEEHGVHSSRANVRRVQRFHLAGGEVAATWGRVTGRVTNLEITGGLPGDLGDRTGAFAVVGDVRAFPYENPIGRLSASHARDPGPHEILAGLGFDKRSFELEVPPGATSLVVIGGRGRWEEGRYEAELTHLALRPGFAVAPGETREVELELDVPLNRPVEVVVAGLPSNATGRIRHGLLRLAGAEGEPPVPAHGWRLAFPDTHRLSRHLTVQHPSLSGPLAGATRWAYGETFQSGASGQVYRIAMSAGDELVLDDWPALPGPVEVRPRGFGTELPPGMDVCGARLHDGTGRTWIVSDYAPTGWFELPDTWPDQDVSAARLSILCSRIPGFDAADPASHALAADAGFFVSR